MPPEETSAPEVSQPAPESPSPIVEAPVETPPLETAQTVPEPTPASVETVPAPETAPDSAKATMGTQPATQTGQIPPNDPLPPETASAQSSSESMPDPIPSAQPAPESPSSATPAQTGILHTARDILVKARVALQDRKRKKRDKIMEALTKKNKITNNEVEKLLHVSDATATRYLSVLVKEGKIRQEKKKGAGVVYTRI